MNWRMRIAGVDVANGQTVKCSLPNVLSIDIPSLWEHGAWAVVNGAQPGQSFRRTPAGTIDIPILQAGTLTVFFAADTSQGRQEGPRVSITIETPSTPPASGLLRAVICDSGTVAQRIAIAKDSSHNGIADWVGFGGKDGSTGTLNNGQVAIDRLNQYVAAGLQAVARVTLGEKPSSFVYPLAALDQLKAGLNKKVPINLGNEIDWDYVPQARTTDGMRRAAASYHQMSISLSEAGFDCGSVSFAERSPDAVEARADVLIKDGCTQWDRWIGHAYQAYDPNWPEGWVFRMKALIDAHVRVAARLGIPCEIDEIGVDPAVPADRAPAFASEIVRYMRSKRIGYAWFIATYERSADGQPRDPHAFYHPWIDLQTSTRFPMFNAMRDAAAASIS